MVGIDHRLRTLVGAALGLVLALGWVGAMPRSVEAAAPVTGPWDGGVNLYRKDVFTTQKTWLWCTAAGVQIVRNIVTGDDDHGRASQERYFDWMRTKNRYDLPESAGVDPVGWTAGLRRWVDDRYRLQAHGSFDSALRQAVIRIRETGLPVALTVAHGTHGWILHGFTANADPLLDDDFRITGVRVTGPLWGRQNRSFGYDMKPNTKLTVKQLRTFFTPWRYDPLPMAWDGKYVSIQPVTPSKPESTANPTPAPTAPPAGIPAIPALAAVIGAARWSPDALRS